MEYAPSYSSFTTSHRASSKASLAAAAPIDAASWSANGPKPPWPAALLAPAPRLLSVLLDGCACPLASAAWGLVALPSAPSPAADVSLWPRGSLEALAAAAVVVAPCALARRVTARRCRPDAMKSGTTTSSASRRAQSAMYSAASSRRTCMRMHVWRHPRIHISPACVVDAIPGRHTRASCPTHAAKRAPGMDPCTQKAGRRCSASLLRALRASLSLSLSHTARPPLRCWPAHLERVGLVEAQVEQRHVAVKRFKDEALDHERVGVLLLGAVVLKGRQPLHDGPAGRARGRYNGNAAWHQGRGR